MARGRRRLWRVARAHACMSQSRRKGVRPWSGGTFNMPTTSPWKGASSLFHLMSGPLMQSSRDDHQFTRVTSQSWAGQDRSRGWSRRSPALGSGASCVTHLAGGPLVPGRGVCLGVCCVCASGLPTILVLNTSTNLGSLALLISVSLRGCIRCCVRTGFNYSRQWRASLLIPASSRVCPCMPYYLADASQWECAWRSWP